MYTRGTKADHLKTGTIFNIWYNKWSGGDREDALSSKHQAKVSQDNGHESGAQISRDCALYLMSRTLLISLRTSTGSMQRCAGLRVYTSRQSPWKLLLSLLCERAMPKRQRMRISPPTTEQQDWQARRRRIGRHIPQQRRLLRPRQVLRLQR